MLGISFEELLPSINKGDEKIVVGDEEIVLNSPVNIEDCKKFMDEINSLT